jgi:hypothetical protein
VVGEKITLTAPMNQSKKIENILKMATGILLLSIVLMMLTIPGFLVDISPGAKPQASVITTSFFILIRLLILMGYIKIIRDDRRGSAKRDGACIGIGIVLIFLAFLKLNAAHSFLDYKDIIYVPVLMFIGVVCDFTASILTFIAFFLQPKKPPAR